MDLSVGNQGSVKPVEVVEALGLDGCRILDIIRTGLFVRNKSGEKLCPLTMLCRRKGRALEISFVGSVFVYKEILIKMEPEETV